MALTKQKFTSYLKAADFRTLFIEEMGWNKVNASFSSMPTFYAGETSFEIKAIAHRNGFQVLQCSVQQMPSNAVCKKLDTKLRKAANDYICIFNVPGTEHHQWVAPIKNNEKRDLVIIEYLEAEKAQFLYEKLGGLSFALDETTTILDVKERVQKAFEINSEKITKDFYTGFNKEHKAFAEFITGIDDQIEPKKNKNKQWYTSVMLNRLMFCYFIQKKGFLDGDENYLRNKLRWTQEQKGTDHFFKSFYRGFLIHLFHEGLNSPKHDAIFEGQYGRIPYLNGGMFDLHQIEQEYADIDIKDEAFESLFEFFDKWRWHLDTRVTASGRDINPDVLGYIFEQYINDRAQMGAYYTKEDITEYIGRNTIIPYLLDAVAKNYPEAFEPDGSFWQFIRISGDDFFYDSVKKGANQIIPEEISRGIDTDAPNLLERRKAWNNPTPASIGLPTEIWRETIERLKRYEDIKCKIAAGKVISINDFITYNLNTPKIAYDFLNKTGDKKFIELFYAELLKVTILDPTCGSGAFLFAALNLLEPLYEVCISRMEEFYAEDHLCFKEELAEIQNKYRSNIQYFIYKSIILRNLYGVDIMAEAVEIAKLRLFLKMVAVVEVDKRADNMGLDPLPDIDFNIRCGNTLVGYTSKRAIDIDLHGDNADLFLVQESEERISEQLELVSIAYDVFRDEQLETKDSIVGYKQAKEELTKALNNLNHELNSHLYKASGAQSYNQWLEDYQPFHWIAEFYQIIQDGGFDVIIGNPPYVEYTRKNKETGKSIKDIYQIRGYETEPCSNLYAFVIERSYNLVRNRSNIGFIVPLTIASNNNMSVIRDYMCREGMVYFSHYEIRPAKLFEGVEQRLTIFIVRASSAPTIKSTSIRRWRSEHRDLLFQTIAYSSSFNNGSIWRLSSPIEEGIYRKFMRQRNSGIYLSRTITNHKLNYRTAGVRYWIIFLNNGFGTESLSNKTAFFPTCEMSQFYMAAFNSNLFWWYYSTNFDMFNLKDYMIFAFRLDYQENPRMETLARLLEEDMNNKRETLYISSKTRGDVVSYAYKKKLSKELIDEIDVELSKMYGFSQEELDFIINYDIKYRMGEELTEDN